MTKLRLIHASSLVSYDDKRFIQFQLGNLARQGNDLLIESRRHCGGPDLPIYESGDALVDHICKLASKSYPGILVGLHVDRMNSIPPTIAIDNAVAELVLQDPDLGQLFHDPPVPEGQERQMAESKRLVLSTGSGMSIQAVILPSTIISQSTRACILRGELTPESLYSSIHECTQLARRLAAGETVNAPTFISFLGVGLPEALRLEHLDATLRPIDADTARLLPISPGQNEGAVTGFIMEIHSNVRILSKFDGDEFRDVMDANKAEINASRQKLEEAIHAVRSALTLAIRADTPVGAQRSATIVIEPLSLLSMTWTRAESGGGTLLTSDQLPELLRWSQLLSASPTKRISLALHRVQTAVVASRDPVDSFIDAVIGWENLFGSSSEATFRVSTSMAVLLSDDPATRRALKKEIAKLYDRRSKVVHGARQMDNVEAHAARERSLGLLVDCLRTLISERPDLLALDSARRAEEIVFGLPAPASEPKAGDP